VLFMDHLPNWSCKINLRLSRKGDGIDECFKNFLLQGNNLSIDAENAVTNLKPLNVFPNSSQKNITSWS